jgi:predicted DNA-binding protein with PD1-like motif
VPDAPSHILVLLRFANQPDATVKEGDYEIVSLVGTISHPGGHHLHMSVSDSQGVTTGGHVMSGCIVRTTLEIAILALEDMTFARAHEPLSGYDELVVHPRNK